MGLFWKKSKHKALTAGQERLAGKIAAIIIQKQTGLAIYLNRKTQYWNRASKITALVLFSLAFGGLSLYLLLTNLFTK